MTDITLHGYQSRLKSGIYSEWNAGHKNVLAVLPTGGGKSIVVSDIVRDGHLMGISQPVIAHRNELVSQMSIHVANRGIYHRIIGSDKTIAEITRLHRVEFGKSFINPSAKTSVVGVDTLINRAESLASWAVQQDRWVIDECFPAGTKISTPEGLINIEDVKLGQKVIAFDENDNSFHVREVKRLFKNPLQDTMIRVSINGIEIEATPNHPFWAKRGWVNAIDLKETDDLLFHLLTVPDTFSKRERTSKLSLQKNWSGVLFKKMWNVVSGFKKKTETEKTCSCQNLSDLSNPTSTQTCKNMFQTMSGGHKFYNNECHKQNTFVQENETQQSYEEQSDKGKSFTNFEKNKTQTCNARWKRQTNTFTRTKIKNFARTFGFCSSIHNKNQNEKRFWFSDLLQTRHGAPSSKNISGSGWRFSPFLEAKTFGSEKGHFSKFVRVESIEVFKPSNIDAARESFVYNIEVDELHTYIANNIVVHNCHHVLRENKWGKAVEMFPNAYGLGVTATPSRADGKGLGRNWDGVFDTMVLGPSMRELVQWGNLSDYEIVCPLSDLQMTDDDLTESGDYSNKKMREKAKKSHIVGDVVENYCKWAFGKSAIVFATDIETAGNIAERFNNFGIRAASLSSQTPSNVREKYVKEFKSGKLMVLVNVDLFDEGFDVPRCEVVIMARPTASLGKYLQMVGRGLRVFDGKMYGLIIDHVSNVIRHGLPDKQRVWTLARRDKRGKSVKDPNDIPLTTCKTCSKPYERFHAVCPYCGASPPLPSPKDRSIAQVDGDLFLLDRERLEQMRAGTILQNPGDVGNYVAQYHGPIAGKGAMNRQVEKIEAQNRLKDCLAQWGAIQRALGFTDEQAYRKFYITTGMDIISALSADKSRQEYDAIAQMVEGWYKI